MKMKYLQKESMDMEKDSTGWEKVKYFNVQKSKM